MPSPQRSIRIRPGSALERLTHGGERLAERLHAICERYEEIIDPSVDRDRQTWGDADVSGFAANAPDGLVWPARTGELRKLLIMLSPNTGAANAVRTASRPSLFALVELIEEGKRHG